MPARLRARRPRYMARKSALRSQIHDVHIGPQSHVVGKVPADVIGVLVNDDLIGIPEPIIAEADIIRCDAKVEPAKPETTRTAACKAPAMAGAKAAREMSVLPRVIDVVVRIATAGVVADPLIAAIDVRSVWVAGLITEIPMFLSGVRVAADGRRAVGRRRGVRAASFLVFASFLTKSHQRNYQQRYEKPKVFFHVQLRWLNW